MIIQKPTTWRSVKHRLNVSTLPCVNCGHPCPSQVAHMNFGKGMGIKVDDCLTFPLCCECHIRLDQSVGMTKEQRRRKERSCVTRTRILMMKKHMWPDEVEENYQRAIQPILRMTE